MSRVARLWGPTLVTPVQVTLYTSPAAERTLIRSLILRNDDAVGRRLELGVQNLLAGSLGSFDIVPALLDWREVSFVLDAGASLVASSNSVAGVSIYGSGTVYLGV